MYRAKLIFRQIVESYYEDAFKMYTSQILVRMRCTRYVTKTYLKMLLFFLYLNGVVVLVTQ